MGAHGAAAEPSCHGGNTLVGDTSQGTQVLEPDTDYSPAASVAKHGSVTNANCGPVAITESGSATDTNRGASPAVTNGEHAAADGRPGDTEPGRIEPGRAGQSSLISLFNRSHKARRTSGETFAMSDRRIASGSVVM